MASGATFVADGVSRGGGVGRGFFVAIVGWRRKTFLGMENERGIHFLVDWRQLQTNIGEEETGLPQQAGASTTTVASNCM